MMMNNKNSKLMDTLKLSDSEVHFIDSYERENFSTCQLRFVQYHNNGKAIHIHLDERDVNKLYATLKNLKSEQPKNNELPGKVPKMQNPPSPPMKKPKQ